MSGEIERRGVGITERARGSYDDGQYELIRTTVAKDCSPAELAMFLEVCARYELDPFSKQIWAIKMQGKVQIIVSRDGMLALANRSPDFGGCESDFVCAKDKFRKITTPEGTLVEHEVNGVTDEERGAIVGAWALVHRDGHRPTYFFARWSTYAGQNVWKSHPEAMIVKVAEGMALRKAFSISGVVGEGEVARSTLSAGTDASDTPVIVWGDNAELTKELKAAFEHLGYATAKIRLRVNACVTDDQRRELLAELHSEADAMAAVEDSIADAEVVPDSQAA